MAEKPMKTNPATDLKAEKVQLRKDIRDLFHQITPEQRQVWSQTLTDRILALSEYKAAKTVMVFLSMAKEYDMAELIAAAIKAGKQLCAPKVDWLGWRMDAVAIGSSSEVVKDEHNIPEPKGNTLVDVDVIDLVLVPGLAFDVYGRRVGRGGGFYDGFLSRPDLRAVKVAPTFDFQVRQAVPCGPRDAKVDIIVTPTKTFRFSR